MVFKKIIGVMACDPQGLIGNNGALPWDYPAELEHFRRTIYGHPIIMGGKTFEAVPTALLHNKLSIVFSRTKKNKLVAGNSKSIFVSSVEEFTSLPEIQEYTQMFMIGGAEIAHLFLKYRLISEFVLTKIHKAYKGDSFLDLSLFQDWSSSIINKSSDYTIYKYTTSL